MKKVLDKHPPSAILTEQELEARIEAALAEARRLIASAGGQARAAVLTPEQRTRIARKAVKARWAKQKQKAK